MDTYLVGDLEHEFYCPIFWGNVIIPTDVHSIIFQRGGLKPPTSQKLDGSYMLILSFLIGKSSCLLSINGIHGDLYNPSCLDSHCGMHEHTMSIPLIRKYAPVLGQPLISIFRPSVFGYPHFKTASCKLVRWFINPHEYDRSFSSSLYLP